MGTTTLRDVATATGRDTTKAKSRKRGSEDDQEAPKIPKLGAKTDISRWRMKDDESRHTWHYLTEGEAKEWKQSYAEKYYLGLDLVSDHVFNRAKLLPSFNGHMNRACPIFPRPKPLSTRPRMD